MMEYDSEHSGASLLFLINSPWLVRLKLLYIYFFSPFYVKCACVCVCVWTLSSLEKRWLQQAPPGGARRLPSLYLLLPARFASIWLRFIFFPLWGVAWQIRSILVLLLLLSRPVDLLYLRNKRWPSPWNPLPNHKNPLNSPHPPQKQEKLKPLVLTRAPPTNFPVSRTGSVKIVLLWGQRKEIWK